MAGGVAIFDYNNDGKLDVFFTNGADIRTLKKSSPKYWNRLFENDGTGHFKDVTAKAGLAGTGYDTGVAIGNYDNDGYEDIFVGGVYRNTLYHNNGDGTLTGVTAKAGLLSKPDPQHGPLWSVGGAWVDVNNDGLLDLLVVNYLQWNGDMEPVCLDHGHKEYCHPKFYGKTPNQLFLNNGDGTFHGRLRFLGFSRASRQGYGRGSGGLPSGWPHGLLHRQQSPTTSCSTRYFITRTAGADPFGDQPRVALAHLVSVAN
jgi:enediyne biosynthesis protein E4